MKKISLSFLLLCTNIAAFANVQQAEQPVKAGSSGGLSITEILILILFIFAVILFIITTVLFNTIKVMVKEQMHPASYKKQDSEQLLSFEEWQRQRKTKSGFWSKILELKPIEKEAELVMSHNYDGIQELNNPIPKWFNLLFYGSIIFGIGYFYYYHIGEYGQRQDQEYETEIANAMQHKKNSLAQSANKIDETTVKVDTTLIAKGKEVYMVNCVPCHGEHGEGLVGPNLADEFWLHGGSINDIFKVVKYGVPDKGMISWEKSLSAKNIAEVSNYILSFQGSNPANAKAPQGEKYEPKVSADTTKNETAAKK